MAVLSSCRSESTCFSASMLAYNFTIRNLIGACKSPGARQSSAIKMDVFFATARIVLYSVYIYR